MSEAIILAGGFGTRLRDVVSDVPKPMAPIAGRPFLAYLLHALAAQGYTHAVLATGYMHEKIEACFGQGFEGIKLSHSVERTPLGTGGAMLAALRHCTTDSVTVLNGDTLFATDLARLRRFATRHDAALALVLRRVDDAGRYGAVEVDGTGRVTAFREKAPGSGAGLINGGIYQVRRSLFDGFKEGEPFSFEKDLMQRRHADLPVYAYADDAFFIDIGVPDDYARAQILLPQL